MFLYIKTHHLNICYFKVLKLQINLYYVILIKTFTVERMRVKQINTLVIKMCIMFGFLIRLLHWTKPPDFSKAAAACKQQIIMMMKSSEELENMT